MFVKYRITLLLVLLFLACIASSNLLAQSDKPTSKYYEKDYFTIKAYYENILANQGEKSGENNNWIHRWLWNHRMDFDAKGRFKYLDIDPASYINNLEKAKDDRMLSQSGWVPVGPVTIPPSYETRSCYSMGRVNCIAFHPTKPGYLYIGTPGGGIWKTEDAGKNWIPLSDKLPTLAISDIAVDPKNPDIVYAATGDFDITAMTDGNAQGIFKSTDAGSTWNVTSLLTEPNFKYSALRKIIINPQNTDQLITAGKLGIWTSPDAGTTWTHVCDSIITDIDMTPQNTNVLYAAMARQWGQGSAGVLKSSDFGASWVELNTGIPAKGPICRMDISVSPADPNYIYVLAVSANSNGVFGFYKSQDAGKTWVTKVIGDSVNTDNMLGAWGGDASDRGGQGSYDLVLLADPIKRNKVYTGGINMWMSENGGNEWDLVSFWIYCFGPSIHADHHYAAYNPVDQYFYWCNDGGVYRTKSIEAGSKTWVRDWIDTYLENAKPGHPDVKFPTVWENLSDGLVITEFYGMSLCKNTPNILAAGSQDNSCYYFKTGDWLNYIPNYDGMETMIDNDNPDIFYGVWQFGGLCKTIDGGKTMSYRLSDTIAKQESGNWVTPIAMDPVDPNVIYIGYKNLWRSNNGGQLWEKVMNFDTLAPKPKINSASLSIIKNSPTDSKYLSIYKEESWYQDTAQVWRRSSGELWLTEDGCKTWKRSSAGLPLDSMDIISIDYDYNNPRKIRAAVYTWINTINTYITTDGGDTWKDISKPITGGCLLRTIVHQPNSERNILYAGTNKGVYYTDDSLDKWVLYSDNLPNCIINELEIQHSTNELFAATYGRGVWKTNALSDDVKEIKTPTPAVMIYPNPTSGVFTISVSSGVAPTGSNLNLNIIDVTGRIVYEEKLGTDTQTKLIKPGLNNGIYFVQLELNGRNYSAKLLVKK